jgi:hypothetical protein
MLLRADMQNYEMIKVIFAQATITIFAVALGYIKLSQEIRKMKSQKIYELKLDRIRKQLAEFYGPLHMLATSATQIAKATWGTDVWEEVWRGTLVPAHLQIENIILSKIDLLDEEEIPKSYFDFIRHSQFNRTYLNREGYGGLSYFEKLVPYPPEFATDISSGYEKKRREYPDLLRHT